jgi:hypothetical protein
MKKKPRPLRLLRETVLCLTSTPLSGIAGVETGSNPHSVCLSCTCLKPTA